MQRIAEALTDWRDYKGVILAPVAYDLTLKQRPDHLIACLAGAGYLCVMMEMDAKPKTIVRSKAGLYVTNMWEDVVAFFSSAAPFVYLHYPLFTFIPESIPGARIIYDVLDDLSIFSGVAKDLDHYHARLLETAHVTLFSSRVLYEKDCDCTRNALLLENGVWANDFRPTTRKPASEAEQILVGYHGVISELIDSDLLDRISDLPGVTLVLVGPIAAFHEDQAAQVQGRYERILAKDSVEYRGKVRYDEIKDYLGTIDVGLVPFLVNEGTNGVSPLKLYEYMAAQLPILALPIATLQQYASFIDVGDAGALLDIIQSRSWKRPGQDYASCLDAHDWTKLSRPLIEALERTPRPIYPQGRSPLGRVDIVNVSFFDWTGETLFKGGAERYVIDLCRLLIEEGAQPRIIQNGRERFERSYEGIPVTGVPGPQGWILQDVAAGLMGEANDADLVIASPLNLAWRATSNQAVIGINHGIFWDGIGNRRGEVDRVAHEQTLLAIERCRKVVCVDTNFINWVRTLDWDLGVDLDYIPNYVDTTLFAVAAKDFDAQTLQVLYPRRLYPPRGFYLTIEAFARIFRKRNDLHLTFCGQALGEDKEAVRRFMAAHPGKVRWIEREMDEMAQVYSEHHIALIPTMASEGTSLSCIEAFASNCAVIASNVGGLPNLVQDRFNGLLIRPTSEDLEAAVEALADNRQMAARLAANAVRSSQMFDKSLWQQKWRRLLASAAW